MVVAVVAVVALAAGGGLLAWRHAHADDKYAAIIDVLTHDPAALPPDHRARVDLSGRFAGITPHDEAFVVRRDDGSFVAMFPTDYGAGTTLTGRLYTSRPFQDGDTYLEQTRMGAVHYDIDIGSYRHLNINDRLNDHWYIVSLRMR